MEDDLTIFVVHIWTWHIKLGGVRLLRFFATSLCCQDMTEDDLTIFGVRIWTWHVKLGGPPFTVFCYKPWLPRYDERWPYHFWSAYLDSARKIRGGPPFTVFCYKPLLPRYDGRRPYHFRSVYLDLARKIRGSAFYGFLLQALVAEIWRKMTLPFLECVFGLGT